MLKKVLLFGISILLSSFLFLSSQQSNVGLTQALPTPTASPEFSTENALETKIALREGEIPLHPSNLSLSDLETSSTLAGDRIYEWSKVVYQSYIDGNYEIVIAKGDGSEAHRLTYTAAHEREPELNRGATKIAFTSNRNDNYEIYVMDADGSNVHQLTSHSNFDISPTWSPNSDKIAYSSKQTGSYEIFVMDADGSHNMQLTSSGGLNCYDPAWSPDGNQIAYVTWDNMGMGYLWTVPATGGTPTIVSGIGARKFMDHPAWAPDRIHFAIDYASGGYFTDRITFHSLAGDLGTLVNISQLATYEDYYLGGWSPDSQQVIFNRIQYQVINNQLYVIGGFMETGCAISGAPCSRQNIRLAGSGLDFFPHWQTADIDPPISTMESLPKFSRADGFPVNWQSLDTGLALLSGFNLQSRTNQGEWYTNYLEDKLQQTEWISYGEPGETIAFRVQAYDEAGNVEPWSTSPSGETQTTLYTFELSGEFADNRGMPLSEITIITNPTPVQILKNNGHFQVLLKNKGATQIDAQVTGYGAFSTTERDLSADLTQNIYFPPESDLLVNGDWEQGNITGWNLVTSTITSTKALTVSVQNDNFNSGEWAITLGSKCPEPCWTAPETVTSPTNSIYSSDIGTPHMSMAMDDDGTLYFLIWQLSGLLAYERSPEGIWSDPISIDSEYASSPTKTYLNILPDGEGFAVWQSPDGTGVKFIHKNPSENWDTNNIFSIPIFGLDFLDAAFDHLGGIYIFYQAGDVYDESLYYLYRTPEGDWRAPVLVVDPYYSVHLGAMTVSPDLSLHFFWKIHESHGDYLYYQRNQNQGSTEDKLTLIKNGSLSNYGMHAISDSDNNIHLFFRESVSPNPQLRLIRYADGTWSGKEFLPTWPDSIALDEYGAVYILNGYDKELYKQPSGKEWSQLNALDGNFIMVDKNGILHLASSAIFYSFSYQSQERSSEPSEVSLYQRIAIPPDIHKPTLSFDAQLRGGPEIANSFFDISVHDGISNTVIYTDKTLHLWEHDWIPLDNWIGKTITVTFTLHQGANDHLVYLDLDDISVGSWETPVIHTISPQKITEIEPQQVITILGENFIQKPSVFIAGRQIPDANVGWIDESTLSILLPTEIPIGIHDIQVINPEGQVAIKYGALRVGWFTYSPHINR